MTFESTKSQYDQEHFTIIEIDAPIVDAGFGTPRSAGGAPSTGTKTYSFTDYAGILPQSDVEKCVTKVSETPTKLQPQKGLAVRATASVSMVDFVGDPNPFAPDVTDAMNNQYGYLAKFESRNILTNRLCRIKNYRVNAGGTIDLTASETRSYLVDTFTSNGKGLWTLKLKDELSLINLGDSVWPLESNGYLRFDIDDTTTTLLVDPDINYAVNDVIRIGEELFKITGVSGIGTGSAELTVQTRGSDIVFTETLSKTDKEDHSAGDEIILCEVSDNEHIADLLERILLDVGMPVDTLPIIDWADEIDEWLATEKVNTIWIENKSTSEQLENILMPYQIDMWFDPVDREVKVSAINAWRKSTKILTEGDQIDSETIKRKPNESMRATRAIIVYDKRYLARTDSIENYKKGQIFKRTELEGPDFYGKSKVKQLGFSSVISTTAAQLLVNRYVNRYVNPVDYSWKTQESQLDFKVGDVVDLDTSVDVGFDGQQSTNIRGQILSIQPKYTNVGREYQVSALSFEPVFEDNSEVIISGNTSNINLYTQYAGAPSAAVTITFIFDATVCGSTINTIPAIRAGAFPAGSKIIIILANGADLMAKGGDGGNASDIFWNSELGQWEVREPAVDGLDGGIVIDCEGVDTDIYFSGATPSVAYPSADGFVRAPSGGDGGFDSTFIQGDRNSGVSANGGNGGDGRVSGTGGDFGQVSNGTGEEPDGLYGTQGTEDGFTGSFGQDGANNDASGGLAGSGIISGGATVNLIGSNSTRYIKGNGDV